MHKNRVHRIFRTVRPDAENTKSGQIETIYPLAMCGGGAENRTPVHESPLIGISRLSHRFRFGAFARGDALAGS